ncbi:MAG TPA: HEAT repeat domain-containing protein, partial [Polyangiales bacterium]|nr:HEAT repeat domain-containing protein [Polyangiales bacterium]
MCRASRVGLALLLLALGAQRGSAQAEPAPAAKPAAKPTPKVAKPAAEPKAAPAAKDASAKAPAGAATDGKDKLAKDKTGKDKLAQSKKDKKAKGPKVDAKTQAALDQARKLLASGERDQVEAGIQSLGLLGGAAAVPPLVERIELGLPADLLEAAVITLMALSQPEAGPVLYELSTHRRPEIRLRALEAISATRPPGAEGALVAALSDSDPPVRSAAATALGELHASGAMEKLFLALDRGNMEASGAIGKVVPAGEVTRLLGYLGKIPLHDLGPALAEVLQRKDV